MTLISMLIPAVLIAVVALLFGVWSVLVRRSGSTMGAISLATGAALATLLLCVYALYAIPAMHRPAWWPAAAALAVFCAVFMAHAIRNAPKVGAAIAAYLAGLATLVVCGQVLWLAVACANGDCF